MDKQKFIIKMYNKIAEKNVESVSDIPKDVLFFLMNFSDDELKKPFARILKGQGRSVAQICQSTNLTTKKARYL